MIGHDSQSGRDGATKAGARAAVEARGDPLLRLAEDCLELLAPRDFAAAEMGLHLRNLALRTPAQLLGEEIVHHLFGLWYEVSEAIAPRQAREIGSAVVSTSASALSDVESPLCDTAYAFPPIDTAYMNKQYCSHDPGHPERRRRR
jgi:hypothetical protein